MDDDLTQERMLPLALRAHRHMIRVREMDKIMLNAQRQGRTSFYMTCKCILEEPVMCGTCLGFQWLTHWPCFVLVGSKGTGEEAIHMGSASALDLQDHVLAQYREQGVLMWRGFSLEQFTNQCFSNDKDLGKARQMPVHYGRFVK